VGGHSPSLQLTHTIVEELSSVTIATQLDRTNHDIQTGKLEGGRREGKNELIPPIASSTTQ